MGTFLLALLAYVILDAIAVVLLLKYVSKHYPLLIDFFQAIEDDYPHRPTE